MRLVLGSGSPRRRELLAEAGFAFEVRVSAADETVAAGLAPAEVACALARRKALAVAEEIAGEGACLAAAAAGEGADAAAAGEGATLADAVVVGADTVVALGDEIFGKPTDAADAVRILSALSGTTHEVITGVCLVHPGGVEEFFERTFITFRNVARAEIDAYVATGEPFDKAGAYGIQAGAGSFVAQVEGDYNNVVGLPLDSLAIRLVELGIIPEEG